MLSVGPRAKEKVDEGVPLMCILCVMPLAAEGYECINLGNPDSKFEDE